MNVQAKIETNTTQAGAPSIQQQLADFAANLSHDAIPSEVRTRAVHHMLDAAGIAMASTRYDFAHKTLAGFRALGGEGNVPVFGMAAHLPPRDAATMNGFLCHGLDYDDTHMSAIVHPTASLLPAVLSAAAMANGKISGEQMVTAFIIGVEAAARIGTAAKGQFHQVGYHPTGMVGIFGCTLAAGRILGLNAKQLEHAQGLALSMASGSMQFLEDGAWNKRFHPGWAASSAITAATLAREGFVGASQAYEGRYGLYKSFIDFGPRSEMADPSLATAGLGSVWELMDVAIKPFPTCHLTHGAIDAALVLRDQIDVADIESVTVKVAEMTHNVICVPEAAKKKPRNDYEAKFSLHYLVAAALIRGRVTLAELEPEEISDPEILELTNRVSFVDDPDSLYPKAYSGETIIKLKDGRELSHREAVNRGAADRPLSNDEIIAKWADNTAMLVHAERAKALQAAVLGLEQADDAVAVFEGFAG